MFSMVRVYVRCVALLVFPRCYPVFGFLLMCQSVCYFSYSVCVVCAFFCVSVCHEFSFVKTLFLHLFPSLDKVFVLHLLRMCVMCRCWFLHIIFALGKSWAEAAKAKGGESGSVYSKIAGITVITWFCYPIVWVFAEGFGNFSVTFEVSFLRTLYLAFLLYTSRSRGGGSPRVKKRETVCLGRKRDREYCKSGGVMRSVLSHIEAWGLCEGVQRCVLSVFPTAQRHQDKADRHTQTVPMHALSLRYSRVRSRFPIPTFPPHTPADTESRYGRCSSTVF